MEIHFDSRFVNEEYSINVSDNLLIYYDFS
mgnify:FL=1